MINVAFNDLYRKQVALLVKALPHVAKEKCFALKGGTAIIVYLISHDHSPHSLLAPVLRDITQDYEQSFAGMSVGDTSLDSLIAARERLIKDVNDNMPENHKAFLRSFYSRQPDWALLSLDNVKSLPAVKWRELNLDKAGEGTCEELLRKLENLLQS